MIFKKYYFEEWRDIADYEGLYQVSNFGRVKSLPRMVKGRGGSEYLLRERFLKQAVDKYGYLMVGLHKEGKGKMCKVHKLVAQHFIPNPHNLPCVNHRDECKTNNIWLNLEFCSYKYNANYGTRNERIGKANTNGKLSKPVLQIDKTTGEVIKEYESTKQVEREMGFNQGNISSCCTRRLRQAYGYIWRYKNAS